MSFVKTPVLQRFSFLFFLLMIVPIASYAFLVVYFSVNIPIMDDYDTVLAYLNRPGSLRYESFFYQHNEHRIAWNRLITEAYYHIFGEINFRNLIYVGNLGLFLLFILLLTIFKGQKTPIIFFIPVTYLLFQPQAWENMTWVTGSLQNYYILYFALLAFYFWNKEKLSGYILAGFFGAMATYTSANGLLVFFLLFAWEWINFFTKTKTTNTNLERKFFVNNRLKLLLILFLTTGYLCYSYFKDYTHVGMGHPYMGEILLQPVLLIQYMATLLGSYVGSNKTIALFAGLLEVMLFVFLTYSRYDQKNSVIYYFLLFVFASVFVIALGRAGFGIEQALSSRYRILSVLALVLIYWAIIEQYSKNLSAKSVILLAIFSAMIFNFSSTARYIGSLSERKSILEEITTWRQTGKGLNYPDQESASLILGQSIEKGLYIPPGFSTN